MRRRVPESVAILAMVCAVGCGGASFQVRVVTAAGRPLRDASVLLYGSSDDTCIDTPHGGRLTDEHGRAYVQARWCGPARVTVAAKGYLLTDRVLNSCKTSELLISLRADPFGFQREPSEAMSTARALVLALHRGDEPALQKLLADPSASSLYMDGQLRMRAEPTAIVQTSAVGDEAQHIQLAVMYLRGCQETWRVFLVPSGDGHRVSRLERVLPDTR
jgi:hypothetical protein